MAHQSKLEQGRATIAFSRATQTKAAANEEELKSYAKKAPMLIKTSGLGAALAFMQAKGGTWNYIVADILHWLSQSNFKIINITSTNNLVELVIGLKSTEYRAITTEVLAFLAWYRRFV